MNRRLRVTRARRRNTRSDGSTEFLRNTRDCKTDHLESFLALAVFLPQRPLLHEVKGHAFLFSEFSHSLNGRQAREASRRRRRRQKAGPWRESGRSATDRLRGVRGSSREGFPHRGSPQSRPLPAPRTVSAASTASMHAGNTAHPPCERAARRGRGRSALPTKRRVRLPRGAGFGAGSRAAPPCTTQRPPDRRRARHSRRRPRAAAGRPSATPRPAPPRPRR